MTKRVAIIGFSFRFPGSGNSRYWQNLLDGRDLVTEVEADRWPKEALLHPNQKHPGTSYTFAAGSVGDVSMFDAGFFGISPREASLMDPQQRLLLEMSWEVLENSGIRPSSIRGSQCGVFIGIASADYSYRLADDLAAVDSSVATGNTASIAANRISYIFDLRGPSMSVDTACSSSLVAFHQAYRSILSGETVQSIAGGISLHLHPYGFITFSKASMLSPRGRCKVFDAAGDGYVRSEGGGLFFLKDYDQAVADGNPILAVVANSAVNTDGRKSGLTVPSATAQVALLEQAYRQAGIDPEEIDYLEAHGTGTAVGDPIETQSIGEALGKRRSPGNPLPIGSVKSNVGHLETASGAAGLVKALYCLQHRLVPATIGLENPNPHIPFEELHIEVVTENRPLKKKGKVVVGVNSFGFGGANAHVILESHEPPKVKLPRKPRESLLPIIISGKDEAALKDATGTFADFLEKQAATSLYDIAYSTVFRRDWHDHRLLIYGTTPAGIAGELRQYADELPGKPNLDTGVALKAAHGPVLIYSGNGSQWQGMGKQLLEEEPLFRTTIQEIDAVFHPLAGFSLEAELAGKNGEGRYQYTEIAQPALFAVQVGITRMLRHRGLKPAAVAGHSVGEVAAAWASGALSLEAAITVIYHRSQLQGTTKGRGAMTAVGLGHEAALQLLDELGLSPALTVAGVNSSRGVTIAGDHSLLAQLEESLTRAGVFQKRLDIDYAFHSQAMDGIEAGVREALAGIQPRASSIPFYSAVTGKQLDGRQLTAEYWWNNIRRPVLFEQAVKEIVARELNIFIEVGPHPVVRSYINTCLKDRGIEGRILPTSVNGNNSAEKVWRACSQAILAGADVDWRDLFTSPGEHIRLPNYPWQRERHWHPMTSESYGFLGRDKVHPFLGYPLAQRELTWENKLDTRLYPTLGDHVVGDAVVFPGTGFAELVLAAAQNWHPGELVEIEGLEIRSPLLLDSERSRLIRLSIEPQDGSVTIKGRDYCGTDPWMLHGVARILAEPRDLLLQKDWCGVPERRPDFTGADHELLTKMVGLGYGPAFQCLDYGWVENNSVLAAFTIPATIEAELERSCLHPALLDCTFQLIIEVLREEAGLNQGVTFIPTRMGRIAFRKCADRPAYARATLLRRAPHSLTAEFTVFTGSGEVVAVVKDARFRSIRLEKSAGDYLRYFRYHGRPKPHVLNPDSKPLIPFKSVQSAFVKLAREAVLERSYQRYADEVDPLLDILCNRFTQEAFQRLSADGKRFFVRDIDKYRAANPDIEPFLDHLISLAEEDQFLIRTEEGWELLSGDDEQASAQDIWNGLVNDYPDFFDIIHAVGRVGMHLTSVLEGSLMPDQLNPQDATPARLTAQVFGAVTRQKVGRLLRELIAQGLKQLPEGRRLGIVEISEGVSPFALSACSAMDFRCGEYVVASTSATTLDSLAQLKERFPLVETRLIGTDKDQPEIPPVCQLAVVTLDFASPEEAMEGLKYARACLVPGGSLVVIGQHPSRWLDFVFGAHRRHWSPTQDGSLLSNQCPASFWTTQLRLLGFTGNGVLELSPDGLSGPYLLVANLTEEALPAVPPLQTQPCSWVLLADRKGVSAQLSDKLTSRLQSRGDIVVQVCPEDAESLTELLKETTASYGQLDGIIFLAGLRFRQEDAGAEAIIDLQVSRCAGAAAILQACEASGTATTCWLVTANAAPDLLPQRLQDRNRKASLLPSDAALWGFGRTLINEASDLAIRLVDLETTCAVETLVLALEREIVQPDDEQEIILTALGERYVPRLTVEPRLESRMDHEPEAEPPTLSLGFQLPGQLSNLRWEATRRSLPAEDEIEIEVHATGLNFRDIMYTLGLLPDEAIENGFAGPTLGLEFSGTVQCVGSEVSTFSPGDRVVGFGPSCFSNRVLTKATAVSHIPSVISFEAAATIPSTFFTAYYALFHLARLQPGEKVLIHGAAGGVGMAAIQIAKWIGAEIYVTAGSDEKRDFLRLLGIDHIYHSRSLSFADEILAQTDGKGVDVVLNSLSGEAINRNLRVLKPFGRFLELGKRDFYENTKIGLRPFRNNISYFGIDADQLMQAHPELTRRLFAEVMALFIEGVLHPLPYHVFEADDVVSAFRFMQQARQIGKIVITYRNGISHVHAAPPVAGQRLHLAADGSYLVTGGLGGFGLKTAEWLAENGARHLILISRSGPASEEAQAAIARLTGQGVTVHAAACDVTDKKALAALLAETAEILPPLRGIVHAATVINDGLISNMDAAQIRSVLEPKALGAFHLHELTMGMPLDFFILFSSATTLFGNPGQGNYVAANSCLDALAHSRRAAGLTTTCVRWGAIDDVGFLARNTKIKDALQNRMGGRAIASATALEVLEAMLIADCSGVGVMEFDWRALSRFLPSAGTPKFSELARYGGEIGREEAHTGDIQQMLEELSDAELLATVMEMLAGEVGEILQVSPDKIDPARSMYDMGLDSLMGVELVVALESRFGIRLPVMALSQSPTIAKLAELIIQRLKGSGETETAAEENVIVSQAKLLASQHGVEVSPESINNLAEDLESEDAAATVQLIK